MSILNQEQTKVLEELEGFLYSNRRFHILSGPAGSGKTWLVKHFVVHVLELHREASAMLGMVPMKPVLTAMTHKAVQVLNDVMGNEFNCTTLHSFLGLRINKEGGTVYPPIQKRYGDGGLFIIIDEASMINLKLWEYLKQFVYSQESIRVLMVGDKNQLTVKGDSSGPCIFYAGIPVSSLSTLIRQKKQSLRNFCTYIKQCKENESLPVLDKWIDGADVVVMKEEDLPDLVIHLPEDKEYPILCYNNNRVIEWNNEIRHAMGLPEHPVKGDRIILNKNVNVLSDNIAQIQSITPNKEDCFYINARHNIYKEQIPPNRHKMIPYNIFTWYFLYSMTIHKSQGSTYDGIIIDLSSFKGCTTRSMYLSLLYVAASRARDRIIFTGSPPARFKGQTI